MTLAEAIAAIAAGHKVRASNGVLFWLEWSSRGPVLMGEPAGYGKPIKHVVFSSEHFAPTLTWEITT
jgi:hypothetical protein